MFKTFICMVGNHALLALLTIYLPQMKILNTVIPYVKSMNFRQGHSIIIPKSKTYIRCMLEYSKRC